MWQRQQTFTVSGGKRCKVLRILHGIGLCARAALHKLNEAQPMQLKLQRAVVLPQLITISLRPPASSASASHCRQHYHRQRQRQQHK